MTPQVAPPTERLVRALESYFADEQHDTEGCQALALELHDPIVRYLLLSIVAEVRRHAELMRSMIDRLKWPTQAEHLCIPRLADSNGSLDPDVFVPGCGRLFATSTSRLATSAILRAKTQHPGFYEGLYPLSLETLARDSEKDAVILHFVLKRLEERAR